MDGQPPMPGALGTSAAASSCSAPSTTVIKQTTAANAYVQVCMLQLGVNHSADGAVTPVDPCPTLPRTHI
jgi:hypothetical protein